MKKRIGCLHAHYTNIKYIENAFSKYDIEWLHFVDPGLMHRVSSDETFNNSDAQKRVKEQVEWMAECKVDAILITCTNYIAFLNEEQPSLPKPIIKIDEPYFEQICQSQQPQMILFTNPATVEGTINRLNAHAEKHRAVDFDVIIIDNAFELIMQGFEEKYNQEIMNFLYQFNNEERPLSVAQLSMVEAAMSYELETGKTVLNPLQALVDYMIDRLELRSLSVE
ncbi:MULTISPECIES: hypothetical protein [Peribacillus]|uniref:hypothetical protein n=1 Tax=Peribacillus TaxID=2675229 RepID=UPI001F4DBC84|nr:MULTISPECIES: hypothetical protein [unclassified Peribacillus]MCK1983174.1 hypothetical protein [Peribacillus sp. Aquil_B1]MCK2006191.1 hypothetical protein [Peribacillus sp. Aquil_B8]